MSNKELYELLFDSSSLREDLKTKIRNILDNLIDNIELTDEVVARVDEETYQFIKEKK